MLTNGELAVAYYPVRGQEVTAAAALSALQPEDYLATTYRGLHDSLAKGIPSRLLWAEFAGKRTGTCKGKGGPMHITYPPTGVMVTTGIVGRSEEHTSELQSLMRISYAVFCLKKKKQQTK